MIAKAMILLKNHKYTYLRLNKNLTDAKRKELEYLNMLYPNLGDAYRFKEMFLVLFQIKDSGEAAKFGSVLNRFCGYFSK